MLRLADGAHVGADRKPPGARPGQHRLLAAGPRAAPSTGSPTARRWSGGRTFVGLRDAVAARARPTRSSTEVRELREQLHRVLQPMALGRPAGRRPPATRRTAPAGRAARDGPRSPADAARGSHPALRPPRPARPRGLAAAGARGRGRLRQCRDERLRLAVPRPDQERLPGLVQLGRLRQPRPGPPPLRPPHGRSRDDRLRAAAFAEGCAAASGRPRRRSCWGCRSARPPRQPAGGSRPRVLLGVRVLRFGAVLAADDVARRAAPWRRWRRRS